MHTLATLGYAITWLLFVQRKSKSSKRISIGSFFILNRCKTIVIESLSIFNCKCSVLFDKFELNTLNVSYKIKKNIIIYFIFLNPLKKIMKHIIFLIYIHM